MRPKNRKIFKRFSLLIGTFIALFTVSSCTKSFCSNLDRANQMYAQYGNVYQYEKGSTDVSDINKDNSIQQDNTESQNANRKELFNRLTGITSTAYSYTFPSDEFLSFMNDKVDNFVDTYYTVFLDGTIARFENSENESAESKARLMTKHVAIYAGFDFKDDVESKNNVLSVSYAFKNMDSWYSLALADPSVGLKNAPTSNFMTDLKAGLSTAVSTTTFITPESRTFSMNGTPVYIEGKTWGQAFQQYGFLEGLFVYPFGYIIHKITLAGDTSSGWSAILAIFVVTLLARLITVIQTIVQTRSQNKQQKIQPLLAALSKKYPDAQTDPEQKRAMTMEQMQIMKQNKIHPFLPMLFIIIQFPLFLCVWSALQGSAALADVKWLNLSLTTTVNQCFTNYQNTPGALTGIFIFIFMTIANILSSTTGLWLTTWRNKKFGNPNQLQATNGMDQNKTMKYMTYGMLIFVVIMGFQLPTGMGIYWFLGALISIIQSIVMEAVQSKHRHKLALETGDGSELAFLRRSKHHNDVEKKEKKSKSNKPLWRK